jgi:hypothetical protein
MQRVWIPDTLGMMCEFINLPCFPLKSAKYYNWQHNQKRRLTEKITFLQGCQGDDVEAVLVEWRDRNDKIRNAAKELKLKSNN